MLETKKFKCKHKQLTLKVIDAFALHEKTAVVCADCGEPLKKLQQKRNNLELLKVLFQSLIIGTVVFYLAYTAFLKFFPLIIR